MKSQASTLGCRGRHEMGSRVLTFSGARLSMLAGLAAFIFLCSCASLQGGGAGGENRGSEATAIAIEHVTILPMTADGQSISDGTVVIRNGRIHAMGLASEVTVPNEALRISGRGKYLMPGLADMHVHIENATILAGIKGGNSSSDAFDSADLLLPYVAQGVLQVFSLSANIETKEQSAAVEQGSILGPHIALAVMVDGDPPINPVMARVAGSPDAGRQIVGSIQDGGYLAVKPYTNLSSDTFSAIIDEARKRQLRMVGHIPLREKNRTEELLQPGFGMVAHTEEWAYQTPGVSEADIPRFAAFAKAQGIWQNTTLKLNERVVEMTLRSAAHRSRPELKYVHPMTRARWFDDNRYARTADKLLPRREKVVKFNPKLLRAFVTAGIPLVVGTDTLVAGVVPGFGLHDELEALAAIGIPHALILTSATRLPAEWLGVIKDRGTVETGKRADLLLLDADPRVDVANTRRISAVIVGGRYFSRGELDERMEGLARRYAEMKQPAVGQDKPGGHVDFDDAHVDD